MSAHISIVGSSDGHLMLTEAAQIRLSLEGDLEAFSELVRPYRPMFYRKALSIVHDGADAEDVVQTALLKAFKNLSQFRLDSQFRTWVTSIVIRESLMFLRGSRKAKFESLDREEREGTSSTLDIADSRENPSQVVERKQLRAAILKAASLLPSLVRSVFILRDLRLLSTADTARMLGITENCVKARLRRARLKLQQALSDFRSTRPTMRRDCGSRRAAHSALWTSPPLKLAPETEMERVHPVLSSPFSVTNLHCCESLE